MQITSSCENKRYFDLRVNNLTLDFLWLTASFGAVTTDLIILSYAVLHRTLGKLVLKNVNQVRFCTIREHK
jgi:hypothetical protein